MRRLLVFFIPLVLFAQVEIDTVIYLPDTLYNGIFIPELNKLYIHADSGIYVVDGATYQFQRIPTQWEQGWADFSYNPQRHKLYYSDGWHGYRNIKIIDVFGDSFYHNEISIAPAGHTYVPNSDRLYVAASDFLSVIDCATDSIIKQIPSPPNLWLSRVYWDSLYKRIYAEIDNLWQGLWYYGVFDCSNDSLLAMIDLRGNVSGKLHFNSRYHKAYFKPRTYVGGRLCAGVIDLDSLRVKFFNTIQWDGPFEPIAFDAESNKVYIPEPDTLYVIDCATDSIIGDVDISLWGTDVILCSAPWSNRVYISCFRDSLWVLDCQTDSVITWLLFPPFGGPIDFEIDPIRQRVFAIGAGACWNALYVLRDVVPGVEEKKVERDGTSPLPTIVRNVLSWEAAKDRGPKTEDRSAVFLVDVTGRKVLDLLPGANDIRHLSPGVYFVRIASNNVFAKSDIKRVIVTK